MRPNSPQDSITTLVLTVAQGKCILDINLFLGAKSNKIELVIPTSTTIDNLIERIILTAQRYELPLNSKMMLSFNKKELSEQQFIFQALFERRPPQLINMKSVGGP